ncbi:MAG: DUF177 domain-containing protein [Chthoniobacterales bacterium]|nr:DUF177 domain-containing protein [Chthoniobacterales bacterium]
MIGVHLRQVPPEGQHLEGEEDAGFLDLSAIGAKPAGPVAYDFQVGLSGGGLFATGRVVAPVQMNCVACLQPFVFQAVVDPFAAQVEIDGRELVDLTPMVREELLLALPNHPRCDLIPGHRCPYQQPETSGRGSPQTAESAWDQLDKLKIKR